MQDEEDDEEVFRKLKRKRPRKMANPMVGICTYYYYGTWRIEHRTIITACPL